MLVTGKTAFSLHAHAGTLRQAGPFSANFRLHFQQHARGTVGRVQLSAESAGQPAGRHMRDSPRDVHAGKEDHRHLGHGWPPQLQVLILSLAVSFQASAGQQILAAISVGVSEKFLQAALSRSCLQGTAHELCKALASFCICQ